MTAPQPELVGPDRYARADLRTMAARLLRSDPDGAHPSRQAERDASRAAWQELAIHIVEQVRELCDRADQVEKLLEAKP
jgi:hypothetical protein